MNLTLIKMVISTLDTVEVKGKDNLDKLLGCINALESVAQAEETQRAEKNKQEAENG